MISAPHDFLKNFDTPVTFGISFSDRYISCILIRNPAIAKSHIYTYKIVKFSLD